ncbi:N-Acetyl-D-glucosamine ABC transport system, permease protein 2 [[Actinomadura] parvosata subsp. kistnae]|uniref:carbohydrate ABC transporter permease n=1 Tax=[Actinomadura] parvosata TaxID=1955412 RepID=UPI000D2897B8|nr:N-Acetyl-D-glucosamine ABC transport system, permease protein 2 [Actinomadura parvosata subsp. kistnae]
MGPGGRLGGARAGHAGDAVPVLLDVAHVLLQHPRARRRGRGPAARGLHARRLPPGARPVEHRRGGRGGRSSGTVNFWLYLRNSIVVATITTAGQVFFGALAAYAFARLRWPGRNAVFTLFVTALMVPPIFTTLPNFVLIKELGLLNTFLGIVLPHLLMTPFAVFFLRQFFLGINAGVEEAARIDGAGHVRTFFRIVLP